MLTPKGGRSSIPSSYRFLLATRGAGMTNRARGGSKYPVPLNKFQTLLVVVMWEKLC